MENAITKSKKIAWLWVSSIWNLGFGIRSPDFLFIRIHPSLGDLEVLS
jgi:hypothetical protein